MTPVNAGVHTRENLSVLARVGEARCSSGSPSGCPHPINSDHLSALGLAAMAAAGTVVRGVSASPGGPRSASSLSLAANWFGDSLDGTVARVRNQQRPRYGFYVDHVIDVAGSAMLLTGHGVFGADEPARSRWPCSRVYLLVSAESYLATHAAGIFRMSFLGFGPTELRIVLAIGAIQRRHVALGVDRRRRADACSSTSAGSSRRSGCSIAFVVVVDPKHASAVSRRAAARAPRRIEGGMSPRALAFVVVGAVGFVVQMAVLTRADRRRSLVRGCRRPRWPSKPRC